MSYDNIYQIRQTITLSQKLVKDKPEFGEYVGSSPEISSTIALLNVATKHKIITEKEGAFFKDFLIEKNKALFASLVSELSKLSFYYGLKDDTISAT